MNLGTPARAAGTLRPQVVALIAGVAVTAAAIGFAAALTAGDGDLGLLAVLAAFTVVAELFDVRLYRDSRVSLSAVAIMAGGGVAGLTGVALIGLGAALSDQAAHRKPFYKTVFNAGTLVVSGAAYVGVFEAFPVGSDSKDWPTLIFPALAGAFANFVVNAMLVGLVVALDSGQKLWRLCEHSVRTLLPFYAVFGVLAASMASPHELDGLHAMAAVIVPVLMMRFTMKRAVEPFAETVTEVGADLEPVRTG